MLVLVLVMTVWWRQLTIVERHELLIPHDAIVHTAMLVSVDRWGWGAFIARW
jgi:hypothetical protein